MSRCADQEQNRRARPGAGAGAVNPWPIDSTNERLAFLNWCWRQGYSAVIVETMDAAGAYDHLDDDQTSNQHD